MNEYDYEKFRDALIERQDEIRLDIKRAERRLTDLRKEDADTQLAIDNVQREHLQANDKY
jgi:F0F1-type ATP synthase membrane subunit b/b'